MQKKDFLKEIHKFVIRNKRKKFLIFFFGFSLTILFLYFIYLISKEFSFSEPKHLGIEKSFLYSSNNKAHDIRKEEAVKFFTYSFIIKDEDIVDKEEYFLFLKTVPLSLKVRNKNFYQIYGFLSKEESKGQVQELLKENIIKKFELCEPMIDKELLK